MARTMPVGIIRVALVAVVLAAVPLVGAGAESLPPLTVPSPLSTDQVVENLVRRNQERSRALLHWQSTRVYHLAYRGFPGDREAEMTVEATYNSPATKNFKVVSQSGSKLILDRVFKKLLEREKEALEPAVSARTHLDRDN